MGLNEENIALFDAYLRNEMSLKEKLAFESLMKNDTKLKANFLAFQKLESTIKDAEVRAFKTQLSNWDQPVKTEAEKGKIFPLRFVAIAAAVTILGFIAFNYLGGGVSNQEMVASYFTPYENIITIRGDKEDLDEAFLQYESGEYEIAKDLFEQWPKDEVAIFYAGESEMALKNYDEAILHYKKLLNQSGVFAEVANFHLGLAYLGLDKKAEAISTLESISKSSDYYDEALLLLKDLK